MRISYKLLFSFMCMAALVAVVGFLSDRTQGEIRSRVAQISQSSVIKYADASAMAQALEGSHIAAYRLIALGSAGSTLSDGEDGDRSSAPAEDLRQHLRTFRQSLDRSRQVSQYVILEAEREGRTEEAERKREQHRRWISRLEEEYKDHREGLERFVELAEQDAEAALDLLETELEPHRRNEMLPLISSFRERAEMELTRSVRGVERSLEEGRRQNQFASIFALLAALGLGLAISHTIVRPLTNLKRAATNIGRGRWDTQVPARSRDELGLLAQAFNQMADDLKMTTVSKERLEASLEEKEVLLREVHHRVKNNLQVICSLLNLEAGKTGDPDAVRLFHESRDRIRSMARVHEQLHQSEDLARIDFAQYVNSLSKDLGRSFAGAGPRAELHVDVQPVLLTVDLAIPCGLIVNELVSNALKHAFPGENPGDIWIDFHVEEERHVLTVRDNGVGMPADIDVQEGSSMGLRVVAALAQQLDADLDVTSEQGTKITVAYQAPNVSGETHERSATADSHC